MSETIRTQHFFVPDNPSTVDDSDIDTYLSMLILKGVHEHEIDLRLLLAPHLKFECVAYVSEYMDKVRVLLEVSQEEDIRVAGSKRAFIEDYFSKGGWYDTKFYTYADFIKDKEGE